MKITRLKLAALDRQFNRVERGLDSTDQRKARVALRDAKAYFRFHHDNDMPIGPGRVKAVLDRLSSLIVPAKATAGDTPDPDGDATEILLTSLPDTEPLPEDELVEVPDLPMKP